MQATTKLLRRFRREKRAVSTVITVMLSLVLIVIIVGNVFLASYKMNQVDMERLKENLQLTNATSTGSGVDLELKNESPFSVHVVAVWVTNATLHQRYPADLYLNSGETASYLRGDVALPNGTVTVKAVTERGNMAVFSSG